MTTKMRDSFPYRCYLPGSAKGSGQRCCNYCLTRSGKARGPKSVVYVTLMFVDEGKNVADIGVDMNNTGYGRFERRGG
ncbi:hypothetical protein I7I53_04611 [Histoplasma capsulatum var. duboisii H88]|uniref:Uncharacterized protein n=1 Tax=Ajellomyces capsulatus (strain H88) TaxID=544711 RepID=A0A8A1LRJ7_AJEC8|nr:hypothetical protein I7I53_04611 [Histoplasma capsulatum var. duboisii H88]